MKVLEVICQEWTEFEYEPGWGASQRPDGISLHLNEDAYKQYKYDHWDSRNTNIPTPNLYSSPCGAAYKAKISERIYEKIQKNETESIRYWQHQLREMKENKEFIVRSKEEVNFALPSR